MLAPPGSLRMLSSELREIVHGLLTLLLQSLVGLLVEVTVVLGLVGAAHAVSA